MFKGFVFAVVMVFCVEGYTVSVASCKDLFIEKIDDLIEYGVKELRPKLDDRVFKVKLKMLKTKMENALNRKLTVDEIIFIRSELHSPFFINTTFGEPNREYISKRNLFSRRNLYGFHFSSFIELMGAGFSMEDINVLAGKRILKVKGTNVHSKIPQFISRVHEMEHLLNKTDKPLSADQLNLWHEISYSVHKINTHKENDPLSYSLDSLMKKLGQKYEQLLHSFPKNQQKGGMESLLVVAPETEFTLKEDKHKAFLVFLRKKTDEAKREGNSVVFPPEQYNPALNGRI